MARKAIATGNASAPLGAYSQAVEANGFVFASGQINALPDGTMVSGQFKDQARQALANLKEVFGAAGLGLFEVAKVTVYMADLKDYAELNEAYAEFFQPPFPARAVVQAAALPRGASIEIEAIAARAPDPDRCH